MEKEKRDECMAAAMARSRLEWEMYRYQKKQDKRDKGIEGILTGNDLNRVKASIFNDNIVNAYIE